MLVLSRSGCTFTHCEYVINITFVDQHHILCNTRCMLATEEQHARLAKFFRTGRRRTYAKGEFVIRPYAPVPGVFYITEGLVKSYDITKYGDENLLIIRRPGEIMGITKAVTGKNRQVIYSALTPVEVYIVSHDDFNAFISKHPELALPVLDMVTEMYRQHSERVMTLEYRTVRERLASFLLSTAKRFGEKTPAGLQINVPLRHQDIASSISATRETTSRTLSELARKGVLSHNQSTITICNSQALKDYIE